MSSSREAVGVEGASMVLATLSMLDMLENVFLITLTRAPCFPISAIASPYSPTVEANFCKIPATLSTLDGGTFTVGSAPIGASTFCPKMSSSREAVGVEGASMVLATLSMLDMLENVFLITLTRAPCFPISAIASPYSPTVEANFCKIPATLSTLDGGTFTVGSAPIGASTFCPKMSSSREAVGVERASMVLATLSMLDMLKNVFLITLTGAPCFPISAIASPNSRTVEASFCKIPATLSTLDGGTFTIGSAPIGASTFCPVAAATSSCYSRDNCPPSK
nr:hypothetical protein Iba_chr11aCG14170 [Ipomoea batatas]